ncbi:ankyrin repeat-containing protein [Orientia tsutsugamushi str. Gilliam]|uniref:Ankyrin repeat-containing protein n=1 Tax=Orientia tsutsugamushi str. Gilliam TaxID=1359184 RepID=A0A2U3RJH1_ORITS|nr:ankyrin repeat domain-containing protein [Orientia tsutsugamushi]SPR13268.1 ankyrin repeat-containing protein [Orientia tsutsugamushi str. Gilliam]
MDQLLRLLLHCYRFIRNGINFWLSREENYLGSNSLHQFAKNGDVTAIERLLVQDNESINELDANGMTPLHYAAARGHIEIVRTLLTQNNLNINVQTPITNITPLHYAAAHGHVEMINLLLAMRNIIADARDQNGDTALHYAVCFDRIEAVKLLIGMHNLVNNSGMNVVHCAAEHGCITTLRYMLEHCADIDIDLQDNQGNTAIHSCCRCLKKDNLASALQILAEYDANIDLQNFAGETALHILAGNGKADGVKLLVNQYNANINLRDNHGNTVMHFAAKNGHTGVARFLLDCNFDINAQNDSEETPLMVCKNNSLGLKVAELFISHIVTSKHCNKANCTEQSCIEESEKFRANQDFVNRNAALAKIAMDMWTIKNIYVENHNLYNLYYLPNNIGYIQMKYAHYYAVENCYMHCERTIPAIAKRVQDNIKCARLMPSVIENADKIVDFQYLPNEIRYKIFSYLGLRELETLQLLTDDLNSSNVSSLQFNNEVDLNTQPIGVGNESSV